MILTISRLNHRSGTWQPSHLFLPWWPRQNKSGPAAQVSAWLYKGTLQPTDPHGTWSNKLLQIKAHFVSLTLGNAAVQARPSSLRSLTNSFLQPLCHWTNHSHTATGSKPLFNSSLHLQNKMLTQQSTQGLCELGLNYCHSPLSPHIPQHPDTRPCQEAGPSCTAAFKAVPSLCLEGLSLQCWSFRPSSGLTSHRAPLSARTASLMALTLVSTDLTFPNCSYVYNR